MNISDCCVFPPNVRKSTPSLFEISTKATIKLITAFVHRPYSGQPWAVARIRRYLRRNLPAQTLTLILKKLIPGQGPEDKWIFPCVETEDRLYCRIHPQCELVHERLPHIIRIMFSEDITSIKINLKRVRVDLFHNVIKTFIEVMTKEPYRAYPSLTSLVIRGGSVHSDDLVSKVEELCRILMLSAEKLEHLHIPVANNGVMDVVSRMKSLHSIRIDRTRGFNKRGLHKLFHPMSVSRRQLQVLHLGVFRHVNFEKEDVAVFVNQMEGLREFSLLDSERALVRLTGSQSPGDKILAYSAFKRAILNIETLQKKQCQWFNLATCRLETNLRHMTVVDRSLKPHYLLESAPRLRSLCIDWQQELCLPPFSRYPDSWFSTMLLSDSWSALSSRLTKLDITFPAAHTINSYSLPLEDYTRLMENIPLMEELRLVGAGGGAPLPLIPILAYCPKLRELVMEKSPVHVPDNYEVISQVHVSRSLKRFYYLGEMSSLLVHEFMMRGIAAYMPELEELEVQPQTVLGYGGLRPDQVRELAALPKLQRLSIPLSIRECIMNLPQVIFILREFPSLRYLTLSWGMWCESYDISKSKISFMMCWLFTALRALNSNIKLQLCYKQHPQEFSHPHIISRG